MGAVARGRAAPERRRMFSEFALSGRGIAQDIRCKELIDDLIRIILSMGKLKKKPHGHTLGSIRRFKGL